MPVALIALFLAAFAFGTTEFVIAGVLPQVAAGLGVSIPDAGYLVTGYALGIAIGGPLLTLATAQMSRRALLLWLAAAFTIGQAACALAPDFASLLAVRVAVAVAHGCFFGVAMVVGVSLVAPEKRGMAVSVVLAGLTVSNIIGVPIGAAIGNAWGWRATFWAMLTLGIIAAIAMVLTLPRTGNADERPAKLSSQLRVLTRQQAWTSLIVMLFLMLCQFVPYTFIAPLLAEVTGLSSTAIPMVLLAIGVGSTLGVFIGGKLADLALMPSLIAMTALQAVVLALVYAAAPYPVAMIAALLVWACLNFSIGACIQTRILTWTADAPTLASSLIPAGFNVGIALAATLGAMLLEAGYGYRSLPLVGIAAMLAASAVAGLSYLAETRRGMSPPVPATGG